MYYSKDYSDELEFRLINKEKFSELECKINQLENRINWLESDLKSVYKDNIRLEKKIEIILRFIDINNN